MAKSKVKKEKKEKRVLDAGTKKFRRNVMIIFGIVAVVGITLGVLN